jgi:hypothetical protein
MLKRKKDVERFTDNVLVVMCCDPTLRLKTMRKLALTLARERGLVHDVDNGTSSV